MGIYLSFVLSNNPVQTGTNCGVMKLRKHGRHALLSRGWGKQDKRSIEPFR